MLYRLHHSFFLVGLLVVGFLAVKLNDRSFCEISVVTLIAYISQMLLIIYYSKYNIFPFAKRNLFWIVLLYNVLMCSLFMYISYILDGDTFMFCKMDALFYYRNGMNSVDIGFIENSIRIIKKYPFDDWGGLLASSLMMSIIPSKIFMNFFYIVTGAVSAVMLFHVAKHFMPEVYSFCASLAYGTSSFMIFFHCTFLKESLFLFLVISSIFFFYRAAIEKKMTAFIGVVICCGMVVFFRPAVTAFLVISFIAYYAFSKKNSAISLFIYFIIAVAFVVSMTFLRDQFDTYTGGGDRENVLIESSSKNYSGSFNFFVGWLATFLGPFPTLFPIPGRYIEYTVFYWPSLVYRLFLAIPFWIGVFYVIKRRLISMAPIIVFVLVEMIASGYVLASFELRKVVLHLPFMYILSFYGLYELEKNNDEKHYINKLIELSGYAFTIGILFVWNIIRVK